MSDPAFIVLVCGSRDWDDYDAIDRRLSGLPGEHHRIVVRHGAATRKVNGREQSADMLADRAARHWGFDVEPFPADWSRHGRSAGFKRNVAMLDSAPVPGLVIAFQRNGSRGTQHTINEARRRGIPVEVHTPGDGT